VLTERIGNASSGHPHLDDANKNPQVRHFIVTAVAAAAPELPRQRQRPSGGKSVPWLF
jgi:hypothetical protein